MKLKCPLLLKPLATIVQENSQSFYPSEPFRISHVTMRHPVIGGDFAKFCGLLRIYQLQSYLKCGIISKATSQLDQVRKYSSRIDLAELEFKACFAKTSIKWHFVVELFINFEVDKSLQSKGGIGLVQGRLQKWTEHLILTLSIQT